VNIGFERAAARDGRRLRNHARGPAGRLGADHGAGAVERTVVRRGRNDDAAGNREAVGDAIYRGFNGAAIADREPHITQSAFEAETPSALLPQLAAVTDLEAVLRIAGVVARDAVG